MMTKEARLLLAICATAACVFANANEWVLVARPQAFSEARVLLSEARRANRPLEDLAPGIQVHRLSVEGKEVTIAVSSSVFDALDASLGLSQLLQSRTRLRWDEVSQAAGLPEVVVDRWQTTLSQVHWESQVGAGVGLEAWLLFGGRRVRLSYLPPDQFDDLQAWRGPTPPQAEVESRLRSYNEPSLYFHTSTIEMAQGDDLNLVAIASNLVVDLVATRKQQAEAMRRALLIDLLAKGGGALPAAPISEGRSLEQVPQEILAQWRDQLMANWEFYGFVTEAEAAAAWASVEVSSIDTRLVLASKTFTEDGTPVTTTYFMP